MSTKMEPTQHTPSVIARLMGLDELPTHQPVQKKRRVLSENYLRRVASIGVREKRSSETCPSFIFDIEDKKEFKDVFNVLEKLKRKKDCSLSVEKGDVNSSLSKVQMALLSRSFGDAKPVSVDKESRMSNEDRDELGVMGSKMDLFIKYLQDPDSSSCKHLHEVQGIPHCSQSGKITVLKSSHASDFARTEGCMKSGRGTDQGSDELIPKLQTRLVAHSHGKLGVGKIQNFLRSQTKSDNGAHLPSTKIVVLKPKRGQIDNAARCLLSSSSQGNSHSINKQHKESHSPENGNSFAQAIEMKNVAKYVKSVRRRSRFSKQIDKQTQESELMSISSSNTSDREDHYEPTFYHSDGSSMASEAEKDILERWKINKRFQEVGVTSEARTLGEVLAMPDHESRRRNLDAKLGEDGSSVTSFAPTIMVADLEACAETEDVGVASENYKEYHFKPTDCASLLKANDVSLPVPNTSTQQDMSIGISEEDSVSSFCSWTDPESFVYSEETYQPSPNSVLEPQFERDISFGSECFQGVNASLHGLQLQLELLKSESEEYSEGTGMIVSSDDDSEEESISNYQKNEKSMKIFSVEESRDYSYLVDVFIEAGFHGRNVDKAYDREHAPECPISHAIFETLEKKYGEQISWKRSDRRLLFDHISSELTEILQPSIGTHWTKPVCKRLNYRKRLEEMKEDIWISLVWQEKQAKNDSSLKSLTRNDDGLLELGDEIDGIVKEIENSLIDELATEVVSMESF